MLQGNNIKAQTQQNSIELEFDRDYLRHLVCERNELSTLDMFLCCTHTEKTNRGDFKLTSSGLCWGDRSLVFYSTCRKLNV